MEQRWPQLKVGLLVNSLEVPAWVERVVAEMVDADYIELSAVVQNASPDRQRSFGDRLRSARKNLFFALYTRIDHRLHPADSSHDPFRVVTIAPLVKGVEIVEVSPRQTAFSDIIEGADLERVAAADLDVLVRFGFRILRGGILNLPRFGVWSYHHGDNRVNRGSMPGFWEVMEGIPTTGSTLQILSEQLDGGNVLDRHLGATHSTSVIENARNLYRKSAPMLMQGLRRLHQNQSNRFRKDDVGIGAYVHPLRKNPTNADMLRSLPRLASTVVREKSRHLLRFDQWFLAYRLRKRDDDPNLSFYNFKHVLPNKDRFWADPFPIRLRSGYGVFFEEFLFKKGRAHISYFEIAEDGSHSEARVVLDPPYHLSYPYVFEFDGERFMIPESQSHRSVELWRCTRFPDQWALETVLMSDVLAADTTLYERNGRWWMFTSTTEAGLPNRDRLELYHADTPLGPWTPHPLNPIKRDATSARPAGKLFWNRERLLRPAQDCSGRYGAAIALNQIDEWDEEHYSEHTIERLTPQWRPDLLAMHTLNTVDDLTIIDGELLRRRFF